MQRNHSIDILRCIFAFMVVYLHTHYWVGYSIDVCRCAVPGFMTMTGYFIYSADNNRITERVGKSLKHHSKIYVWALLLYVVLTLWFCYKYSDYSCFTRNNLLKFAIFAETDFLAFGFHLWYLHAVIYALVILWLFSKSLGIKWIAWLTPLFLLLNLEVFKYIVRPYWGSYHLPTYISFGIPYLIIGMGIKKYKRNIQRVPARIWLFLTAILFVVLYIEGALLKNVGINPNDKYVSTILLIVLLMFICISFPTSQEGIIAKIGRKYSLDIYVFHNFMLFLYYSSRDKIPSFVNDYAFKYGSPFLIFVATLIFSIVFRHILSKVKC